MYTAVSSAVASATPHRIGYPYAPEYQMISSFEKNPASGGTPAIASVAIHMKTNVRGMNFRSPPWFRMSFGSPWCASPCPSPWPSSPCAHAWCTAWITAPAPRKRSALKKACVIRWKTPAVNAPTPTARNM